MSESNDLKAGDRCEYKVGDKTLIIEPIPYGRLSKLVKIVLGSVDNIGKMETKDVMYKLPEIFDQHLGELISLIFDKKKHPFLNKEWVNDNMSLVDMRVIIEKGVKVNGIDDFLEKTGIMKKKIPESNLGVSVDSTASPAST